MPRKVTEEEKAEYERTNQTENNSVPPGHRAKCRSCGAVDKIAYRGQDRRKAICAYCGSTLARRKAPRKPKIISFVVLRQMNGEAYEKPIDCNDLFSAERLAYAFVEGGPVARIRIAQIVELLDNERTGNVRVLRYDNFRTRRGGVAWTSGCGACKGRGLVAAVVVPAFGSRKAVTKFLPCGDCHGLGGELTRRVNYRRGLMP